MSEFPLPRDITQMSVSILWALQSLFHSSGMSNLFITGFGNLLCCRIFPYFLIILVHPSVLLLQLALVVSESLVSRYLAYKVFWFVVAKDVRYKKTILGVRTWFNMKPQRNIRPVTEYFGLSVKSLNPSGPVTWAGGGGGGCESVVKSVSN